MFISVPLSLVSLIRIDRLGERIFAVGGQYGAIGTVQNLGSFPLVPEPWELLVELEGIGFVRDFESIVCVVHVLRAFGVLGYRGQVPDLLVGVPHELQSSYVSGIRGAGSELRELLFR